MPTQFSTLKAFKKASARSPVPLLLASLASFLHAAYICFELVFYHITQLYLIAQQQASNERNGIEDPAVKLWSSAAPPKRSYLMHARPRSQVDKNPILLREFHNDTLIATHMLEKSIDAKNYVKQINAACRKVILAVTQSTNCKILPDRA
ncbi:unnamed protein product [Ectocarpus sp. CCAP 1310/34]|nr:unnamed protein product [Ectocarpus sp. CCAP 1310/34]